MGFLDYEEEAADNIDNPGFSNGHPWISQIEEAPPSDVDACRVEGPSEFVKAMRDLIDEYQDIFASELKSVAYLPPMEIKVDLVKWQVPANHQPPRRQPPPPKRNCAKEEYRAWSGGR